MEITKAVIQYVIGPSIIAVIALVPIFLKMVVPYFQNKQKNKEIKQFKLNVEDISQVYHIIGNLMTQVPTINRCMILKSHNGGGIPSPNTPVFITALHEVVFKTTPMLEDIQKRPVDSFHAIHILAPLASTGKCLVTRETADSHLKELYEAYRHEWSRADLLVIDKSSMIYLVVSFETGASQDLTPFQKEKVEAAIYKIKNIFNHIN